MSPWTIVIKIGLIATLGLPLAGCPVYTDPGAGTQLSLKEEQIHRRYYLYLPAGYDPGKRYPLVMAIHGHKLVDTAHRQVQEWQSTADKYGFIVAAPEVALPNPVPLLLDHVDSSMKRDERVIMNVLEEVLTETSADPNWVFITSISSGGALMHYVANKYPERFAGLAARGCWFNANILSEENAKKMAARGFRVLITYAEYDGLNIKLDSWNARRWYEQMGLDVELTVMAHPPVTLPGFGHVASTVPDKRAGEFFARCVEEQKAR